MFEIDCPGTRVPYSTYSLCSLCHSSSDSSGYSLNTLFFPSGRRTYAGAESVMSTVYRDNRIPRSYIKKPLAKLVTTQCTISSGTLSSGSSIADAKGCKRCGLREFYREIVSLSKEECMGS